MHQARRQLLIRLSFSADNLPGTSAPSSPHTHARARTNALGAPRVPEEMPAFRPATAGRNTRWMSNYPQCQSVCQYCGEAFLAPVRSDRPLQVACSVACTARVRLAPPGWTVNHEALLAAIYYDFSYQQISELLGTSESQVEEVVRRTIRIKKTSGWGGFPWSESEVQMLRDFFPFAGATELQALFGRSIESIRAKANGLRIPKSAEYLAEIHMLHLALPPDVRELISLTRQIKRKLNEKHRRSAGRAVRSTVRA